MKTYNFEQLQLWQLAHEFVLDVYSLSNSFPKEELFGITSQLKRAAISIPANIAEGYRKTGAKDKLRFYNVAYGSAGECRYYIILIKDLEYIKIETYQTLINKIDNISKLINAYSNGIIKNTT